MLVGRPPPSPLDTNGDSNNLTFVKALLAAIPAGIVVTDRAGGIVYANAEAERLFGYSSLELLGESVDMLLPDRFSKHHHQLRESYHASPATRHMGEGRDLFGRHKSGSEFPLEVGLRPMIIGEQTWAIATIVDITQRKALEARFEKVIDASPYGKLLVDSKGVIQLINPALLRLFGYEKSELLGQSLNILLPERYRVAHDNLREGYNLAPSLRAMGVGRDLTGLHKSGTEIPIEIGLSPVDSDKGPLILAVITDITERKRMELSLQQANAHMEEFTSVASHDLKSPLRGISDLMEWISEDLDEKTPASVLKNIERINIRVNRMESLVEDLLTYARAGKQSKNFETIDVDALIKSIIEIQPIPPQFCLSVDVALHQIHAAKTPLETVLRNLISNALKHHDGLDPQLNILVEASDNFALFRVLDNGPGIPQAAQERVFRLFQTLAASDSQNSGLGLAMAKRITESHGGKIQLVCNEGCRGAEFKIYWPRFPRKDITE